MTAPEEAEPLPGLGDPEHFKPLGEVERGLRRTLKALHQAGRLEEIDAGRLALSLSLSRIIADKERTRKTSTVSNDARLLLEILDSFKVDETEADDKVAQAMAAWSSALSERDLDTESAP